VRHEIVLRTDTTLNLSNTAKRKELRVDRVFTRLPERPSNPIFRWENNRPRLAMGRWRTRKPRALGRVVYAHDSAGLFRVVLGLPEQHRLPRVPLRLDPQESAASVEDLRHGFALPASALLAFCENRDAHAEHDTFTAAAISRIAGACHDRKRSDLRFKLILH
jgi:hypothetical protein